MKTTIAYFISAVLFFVSCSDDDISIEENNFQPQESIEKNIATDSNKEDTDEGTDKNTNPNIEPCTFNISEIKENQTISLDCDIDLEGKIINLPENVIFEYNGGTISNGSLNFSGSNNKIDGKLMNSSIDMSGEVELIDSTFIFTPSKWKTIVEGNVSYNQALENNKNFEGLMFKVRDMGADTFEVDQFDAFFEISTVTSTTSDKNFRPSKEAVNVPSNFHLKMSNNTTLRTFTAPSDRRNGTLLAVRDNDNVKISGGNLIGDALTREYIGKDSGDIGSRLITVHASRFIEVDNVNFEFGSAGGVDIHSLGFPFNPDYIPSENIVVKNCIFKNIRRIATILTDGNNIVIEGNTYINSGQPLTAGDNGGNVGYAINFETFRKKDENGILQEFQRVTNATIRNNTEKNSRIGFLLILGCSNIIAENNLVETRMAVNFSNNIQLSNNTFNAVSNEKQDFAIFCAGEQSEFTFDNEIYNNTIKGNYGTGISLLTQKCKVYGNNINCNIGVQLLDSKDIEIYNNTINGNNSGIFANLVNIENISVSNNTINAGGSSLKFNSVNEAVTSNDLSVNVNNNIVEGNSSVVFSKSKNFLLSSNDISGKIGISNATNIKITSNKIAPFDADGIKITGINTNISIEDNTIEVDENNSFFKCINNESDDPQEIESANNLCN